MMQLMKALLKRVNELYNAGFINPEYYVTDAETAKAAFINGESVTVGKLHLCKHGCNWIPSMHRILDAKLAVKIQATTDDPEGGTVPAYRANNPFGMMIGFSSQASEDEIKAAWMYMEWMTQEDNLFTMQWVYRRRELHNG